MAIQTSALSTALRRLMARDGGASVVEFALFAPILCLALLTTVDLGTALSQRMSLGHVLRSGAQVAMEDPGVTKVENVLESTAQRNFQTASDNPSDTTFVIGDTLDLAATRFCACPEAPDTTVTCSTTCAGTVPTFIYYKLEASKTFAGVLLHDLPLGTSTQVQVR